MRRLLSISLLLLAFFSSGHAQSRVALVIGNESYEEDPLPGTKDRAHAMTRALQKTAFQVSEMTDLNVEEMRTAIRQWERRVKKAGTGISVFYFNGHGYQRNGTPYLAGVEHDEVSLSSVFEALSGTETQNIVIVDACRSSPNESTAGLSVADPPSQTALLFATASGNLAWAGVGFTEELASEITAPGNSVTEAFRKTAETVRQNKPAQEPWMYSSLTSRLVLNESSSTTRGDSPVPTANRRGRDSAPRDRAPSPRDRPGGSRDVPVNRGDEVPSPADLLKGYVEGLSRMAEELVRRWEETVSHTAIPAQVTRLKRTGIRLYRQQRYRRAIWYLRRARRLKARQGESPVEICRVLTDALKKVVGSGALSVNDCIGADRRTND